MLKKSLTAIVFCALLSACVTEPRDPAFAGLDGINTDAAAKNRVSLGLTYLKNGNFSQAKANLDKALNFAPKSADAHFAMAYYYQQVDELALTEEYYLKALKFAPENPNIINSYGAFLCEQGRYEKAKSYFLRAVTSKSYVSVAETYENLAICAADQGKTDEAIGFFELALNHQPTRGKSLFFLAQLHKTQGNYGEAKKSLWKYDRVSRVSPESLWLAYEIAQGLGDTKGALDYGELMKSMFPEHPNTALFKKQMGKFQPVATVKNKRRESVQKVEASVSTEVTKTDSGVRADAAEKREVALEAALAADFNNTKNESATIDGAFKRVNDLPVTVDGVGNVASNEAQDTATRHIAEVDTDASYHVVVAKESLYRITLRYNVKMKYLMQWNNIDDPSAIKVGMKLRLKDPKNNY
jgi:type IV pilus assembly protein PilF